MFSSEKPARKIKEKEITPTNLQLQSSAPRPVHSEDNGLHTLIQEVEPVQADVGQGAGVFYGQGGGARDAEAKHVTLIDRRRARPLQADVVPVRYRGAVVQLLV